MNSWATGPPQSCRCASCGASCGPSSASRCSHSGIRDLSTMFGTFEGGKLAASQFWVEDEFRLEYKRLTTAYSTSLVLLKISRSSKRRMFEKLSTPDTLR